MRLFYRKLPLLYFALLIFFTAGMTGCGKSPELENYERCVELLNHERKEARKSQNYSYDSQRFLECRAPVQYSSKKNSYIPFPNVDKKNNFDKIKEKFIEYRLPVHQLIANFVIN